MSLLELLFVMVIVGLLASIAYPSYSAHVYKARRADGQAALMRIEVEQVRHRAAGLPLGATLEALGLSADSPDGHYTLSLVVDGDTFTATATPTGPQVGDPCGALSLTRAPGITHYGAGSGTTSKCWGRSS